MKLLDIMTSPWAIMANRFEQIIDIYNAHIVGPKIDIAALEARLGKPLGRNRRELIGQVTDGVAVLDLEGPLAKRMSSVSAACEGTSTNLIFDYFTQALEDPSVKAIVLNIDSPGGTVDGTMDLARAIYAARGRKPIVALADGCMCSAAYWIGAACDSVWLANDTTVAGSIGVVCTHVDRSEAYKKAGLVVTEITAGEFKRVLTDTKPLTKEGKDFLKSMADDIYTLFVEDISTFRGVPVGQVLDQMAEGRVFMGQKAIAAGLADGVSSLDALISSLSQGQAPQKPRAGAARSSTTPTSKEVTMTYTREDLDANAPDLVSQLKAEGKAEAQTEYSAQLDAAKAEFEQSAEATKKVLEEATATQAQAITNAVTAETARIKGIFEAADGLDLKPELVAGLAFDGKTTAAEASVSFLRAVKAQGPLNRIISEASKPVGFGGTPGGDASADSDLRSRWESSASIRNLYGTFEAFSQAQDAAEAAFKDGRIRTKN